MGDEMTMTKNDDESPRLVSDFWLGREVLRLLSANGFVGSLELYKMLRYVCCLLCGSLPATKYGGDRAFYLKIAPVISWKMFRSKQRADLNA